MPLAELTGVPTLYRWFTFNTPLEMHTERA